MIGAVFWIVTPGFKNILIVDDHPDVPGKSLIGIAAHQTASGPLTQKTSGFFDFKDVDTVTQRLARSGRRWRRQAKIPRRSFVQGTPFVLDRTRKGKRPVLGQSLVQLPF